MAEADKNSKAHKGWLVFSGSIAFIFAVSSPVLALLCLGTSIAAVAYLAKTKPPHFANRAIPGIVASLLGLMISFVRVQGNEQAEKAALLAQQQAEAQAKAAAERKQWERDNPEEVERMRAAKLEAQREKQRRQQAAMAARAEAARQAELRRIQPQWEGTGIEITKIYHRNEVKADALLKGKRIQVTGKVKEIRKDMFDDIVVDLRGERGRYSFADVHCDMGDDAQQQRDAMMLDKGQTVTFNCVVGGMVIKSVQLSDCKLIK